MRTENTPNTIINAIEKTLIEEKANLYSVASVSDVETTGKKVEEYKTFLEKTSRNLTNLALAMHVKGVKDVELFDLIGYLLKYISNEMGEIASEIMAISFVENVYKFTQKACGKACI